MHRILVSTGFCEIMLIFTCFAFDLQPFYKNVAKIIHLRTRADVHMLISVKTFVPCVAFNSLLNNDDEGKTPT